MGDTKIEWASKVWNFVRGCRRVSPGCGGPGPHGGCYAERLAIRQANPGGGYEGLVQISPKGPRWTGEGRFVPEKLAEPLRTRRPRDGSRLQFFVNSMSDLFFEEFSFEQIAAGIGVMAACPEHDFLVLTKRPKRAAEFYRWLTAQPDEIGASLHYAQRFCDHPRLRVTQPILDRDWPLTNLWLGVSAENQEYFDERFPILAHQIPAAVKWVSAEPLLGPIDLKGTGRIHLAWCVVGGESGPGARAMAPEWARSLRDQCTEEGIPYFFKQWGGVRKKEAGRILDGRTWDEFPTAKGASA